ncbi:MAG: nicotinate phosphoribosyltransferase [Bacteroidota bacterium]|nr:nicotinate phosphoribosyltransferase [Candidatus Kapabacteria bacterium]MDW8220579.1 nicotinate phosphoribosyltransferase [Bacteroidota bacterium]
MNRNIILLTDSYKVSHYKQYPPKTTTIYSYFESRGGMFDNVVFFGLQYYLREYLAGQVVTRDRINEAALLYEQHFGNPHLFNRAGWEYILQRHNGRLPVRIKAVPEGSSIPTHNVLMTIENTDPACYWLTNFLETLLVQVWYGCTVATQSREIKRLISQFLHETGDPLLIDFKLHDFGFRGVSSVESAGIGGAAHLVNFMGTDTVAALTFIREYYNTQQCYGFSIPAAEHSTITSWGREREVDAYRNMLIQYPEGLVACVSDSYDIFHACDVLWGEILHDDVLQRKGTLVVRPDSGNPVEVVVQVLEILGRRFGTETNNKGFRVLHPNIRVIQGDGVDYTSIREILSAMKHHGWSADNVAFGMGGALLQKLNRDTQKFAFKCSAAVVDGEERAVYKQPVTDSGKVSKRGRLKLIRTENNSFATVPQHAEGADILQTVFENGFIRKQYSFDDVKRNAALTN